ncbi:MAG: hypothetical protein JSU63_05705 [Phycisphaerales bacterium]|nr:MAG: hypothetical protein JSU63_05705 [Phycisphaerales bacterium]
MKNLGTLLAAVFIAIVLLLYMCTFQVRFTEVAIKKTWGSPARNAITQPGLKLKWPSPIQSVVIYDKRMRIMEDRTEETRTVDGKNVMVTTFTAWRIVDPAKFHTNFPGGEEDGEKKLRTTVVTQKHAVIGKHNFSEFVSTDPAKRKIREIEREIQAAVTSDAGAEYGIEVVDFGIKKLGLPSTVTTAIFESMKSNEQKKAARYQAEGEARANDIIANAKAAEDRIRATARKKAEEIKAEAEEVVSDYYKEFDQHPELRIFLDSLRVMEEALQSRTTLIIDTSEAPWDVFDEESRRRVPEGDRTSDDWGGAAGQPADQTLVAQETD